MQRFEILTSLPSRLSCIIMQDWLNLKNVMNLDSAFCCKTHRSKFTDLVQSEEYFICEQVTISNNSKILKVLRRFGAKLRAVVIATRLRSKQRKSLVKRCPNLTHVRFLRYYAYFDTLQKLLSNKVIMLDVSATYLDHLTLSQIAYLCPCLRTLGLADASLEDLALSELTKACPHVLHLNIARNSRLTDHGILNTVMNLKSLRGLNIKGCASITDASLMHVHIHCAKTLNTLQMDCRDVSYTRGSSVPAFSVNAICELLSKCTRLRTFHIEGSVAPGGAPIQIPLLHLCHITTLVLGKSVCIVNINIDAADENCANLHTLVTDLLYSPALFVHVLIRCYNLREIILTVRASDVERSEDFMEYADTLIATAKKFKPKMVVQCVQTREDYSEYDIMRM